ncbi:AAA family ATPase [Leptolyngbya sp. FACHB-16]|uniref:ParA family protein n=1 Tax=unclassified Leptolyngbya TaxID=2650499 RepID=UPI001683BED4|nr:AAA family ATPase [Leptolyngbya sp. FACHB-16]MBD2156006.1 AAA family ATPase [Leptolyngbya sp. FACHB-16]
MVQKIALFSPKGGVGRTTTALNLGWMLAIKGKRVILVDADPQCVLTELILGSDVEDNEAALELVYNTASNIRTGLAPAFESQPKAIEAVNCIPIKGKENLFLLPGSIVLSEYEVTLGIAQELGASVNALKNLPGSLTALLNKTATKFNADYILIDMSPSFSAINQNLLMTSDFFIAPLLADISSKLSIDALIRVLPKWHSWATTASSSPALKKALYPFPDIKINFLGTIIQNFLVRHGNIASVAQTSISKLEDVVSANLVPMLRRNSMQLPDQLYTEQKINNYTLAKIPSLQNLFTLLQLHGTPVYELTPEQLNYKDLILEDVQREQEEVRHIFEDLADKIIQLTSQYAAST